MSYAGPEAEDVRAALDQILCQPEFQSSPRLSSFLRFVVEETLEGRANRLKAFTIATSVFGRDEGFDPQTNPIVRVEALRLRRVLDQYYSGTGANDAIEIRIRRGSYVPEFSYRHSHAPDRAGPDGDSMPTLTVETPALPRRPRWALATAAAVALIAGGILLGWQGKRQPVAPPAVAIVAQPQAQATIRVGPFKFGSSAEMASLAEILETRIEDTISRFDNPLVIHDPGQPQDSDYQITASLVVEPAGTAEIGFRMVHAASREIVWTRLVSGIPLDPAQARADGTINMVAASIAQTYGAVFSDMRKRLPKNPDELTGYGCVILAYGALNSPASTSLADAQACLEKAVAQTPSFASGYAALAHVWVTRYLMQTDPGQDQVILERASEYANRAVSLAPQKSRPHTAQFTTRFFSGRIDDAFEAARVAIELNPYAAETFGRVGAAHMLRGQFDEGRPLIKKALASLSAPPGWLEFYSWLDAWQQGDLATAHRHATRRASLQFPLGILARIITATETGDTAAVKRWSDRLPERHPGFAADLSESLRRYGFTDNLRGRILAALGPAGLTKLGAAAAP